MIEDINTILLYIFVILLLFCIMYILFYSDQKISFYDNIDINLDTKLDTKIDIKEKFETLSVSNTTYYIFNPPESSRRVSDNYDQLKDSQDPINGYYDKDNHPPGYPNNLLDSISSMLDTLQGWTAKNNENINNKWLQIDLGSLINVVGIVTQGRGPGIKKKLNDLNTFGGESVTSYKVIYTDKNTPTDWKLVDNGKVFIGNTNENPPVYTNALQNNKKIGNVFTEQIQARYIRIIPVSSYKFVSMRAGILVETDSIIINNIPYLIKLITPTQTNTNITGTITINNNTYNINNPPEDKRLVSDSYDKNTTPTTPTTTGSSTNTILPRIDNVSSMLDTLQGWTAPKNETSKKWLQIDLGTLMNVAGVITQGKGPGTQILNGPNNPFGGQSVTEYKVIYSTDSITWYDVDNGKAFPGNTNENPAVYSSAEQNNTKIGNLFLNPISAQYIQIIPQKFYNFISMRAGILTIDTMPTTTKPLPKLLTALPPIDPYYSDTDGRVYLQSLTDFNNYILNNKNNLTKILSTIEKAKNETSVNNNVLTESITNLYYKQYLEFINKINAVVYNQSQKSINPKTQKLSS